MRELMENDVFSLIPTGTAAIENDRELWRFDPKAACCAQAPVGIIQWHQPNLATQRALHIPHQCLDAERSGDGEIGEQSLAFLHECAP
ncbi:hypothetical protein ACFY8W_04105 [Streptomyces sp. NPDC012637]|uniref:hypothetical protein n=1 Tax=Streptomyces sp. NPDC012637 TaxID=3364842 RepID=UPI0036E67663